MFQKMGSVLGPQLFTIYVYKWFSRNSQYISYVIMFTDDNSVLIYDNNYGDLYKFSFLFYHMYLSGYRQISLY